jgi:hypothetical protein
VIPNMYTPPGLMTIIMSICDQVIKTITGDQDDLRMGRGERSP